MPCESSGRFLWATGINTRSRSNVQPPVNNTTVVMVDADPQPGPINAAETPASSSGSIANPAVRRPMLNDSLYAPGTFHGRSNEDADRFLNYTERFARYLTCPTKTVLNFYQLYSVTPPAISTTPSSRRSSNRGPT